MIAPNYGRDDPAVLHYISLSCIVPFPLMVSSVYLLRSGIGTPECAMHCLRYALSNNLVTENGEEYPVRSVRVLHQTEWDASAQEELKLFKQVGVSHDNMPAPNCDSTCLFGNISESWLL